MSFSFENQGTQTYLVYTVQADDVIDTMSLGMLTNNKIPGLAQTLFTQMDDNKFIKFNVSAKLSVAQFFTGVVNRKRLLGVLKGIVDGMLSAEEYMLESNSIILDTDYIFTDVSTCETVLVCLPISNMAATTPDMGAFFKNIVFTTQFDQTENCEHVAKIINYLNGASAFTLTDFKRILDDIDGQPVVTGMGQIQPIQTMATHNVQPPLEGDSKENAPISSNQGIRAIPLMPASPSAQMPSQAVPMPSQVPPVGQMQNPVMPPSTPNNGVPVPPKQVGGIAIPQNNNVQQPQSGSGSSEKDMSWFYLMQHYTKDNKAAYKAQKEAKKQNAAVNKGKGKNKTAGAPQNDFAIPGMQGTVTPTNYGAQSQMNISQNPVPQKPVTPPQMQPVQTSQPVQQPLMMPANGAPSSPMGMNPVASPMPVNSVQQPIPGAGMSFGETTVLGAGSAGETTVLSAIQDSAQMQIPYLIRIKTNEKINLTKPVFRLGKERSFVDYFIPDNSTISRSHANILNKEGMHYIVDTNSTNHTYVNGAMIQSNVETALTHGDKIRLANEEFEFKLY